MHLKQKRGDPCDQFPRPEGVEGYFMLKKKYRT
jgi:hypothetical protein